MEAHQKAIDLVKEAADKDKNEATTRHQIIDVVIHEILEWPRSMVPCEESITPGYADYVLERGDGTAIIIIEAKKEGVTFDLPQSLFKTSQATYVRTDTLRTSAPIRQAMDQVREYCLNRGCEFAAITNGHQWVIFKAFQREKDWRTLKSFAINGLDYFSLQFTEAHNNLCYDAITSRASLRSLLPDAGALHRELHFPKNSIVAYDAQVDVNNYASSLRPIAEDYFGVIDPNDDEFMDKCYVSAREYDIAFANARRRLEDALTPFLQQYDIVDFRDEGAGGAFGKRLTKAIRRKSSEDVIVLFGGKGVGKSTFLRRLLFHRPPQTLRKNAAIALIDLLDLRPDKEEIHRYIWDRLIASLDLQNQLSADRAELCRLFSDRFENAQRQELFGLNPDSEAYNLKLNELIARWKEDKAYVAERLSFRAAQQHKGVIVVLDNTDQYEGPEELQEYCFTIAREIATKLNCLVVVAMREERFYESTIRGVLDAYQSSGFHITAPPPRDVFVKRFDYIKELLNRPRSETTGLLPVNVDYEVTKRLFDILTDNFKDRRSHLGNFLSACTRGNIRLALELFRDFLTSGYTNVTEMTNNERWTLQAHQVLKPFMIPSRFFYSEAHSRIPNLFQIRHQANGSHFTALRVLGAVKAFGSKGGSSSFIPIAQLRMHFAEAYNLREDFDANCRVLLEYGLLESNNRMDKYSEQIDSVKITPYGSYMLESMAKSFTYIELTCVDCAVSSSATAAELAELSNDEYRHYSNKDRMDRVRVRLQKAESFINYLLVEEEAELRRTGPQPEGSFAPAIKAAFLQEKRRVLKSAQRNVGRYS
jgi:hypothetical protein